MRPHQSFCLYANTSLNAGGITPQLKLRIKFYCSWNWCFFFSYCYLFVILLWVFYFYFYSYFLFYFLYYQLHHHHPLIPTVTPITLPLSPVLQSIGLLPNYSFCTSHPLTSFLILPQSDYLSLLHTHHLLTNLLYQFYTTTTPYNPWHKHPTLQQKYTQTHTRATKPSSPHITSPTHTLHFLPPLLVPP
jgi:hypothetical protein